jgi:hypothetical protein
MTTSSHATAMTYGIYLDGHSSRYFAIKAYFFVPLQLLFTILKKTYQYLMKYVPFLKVKQGELSALKHVSGDVAAVIKPYHLFLNDVNTTRAGEYLDSIVGPLAKSYEGKNMEFYADLSIFTDYEHIHICEVMRNVGLEFTFVINGLNLESTTANYLRENKLFNNGTAIRLRPSDGLNFESINSKILRLEEFFGIDKGQIDLILDFGYISANNTGLYTASYEKLQDKISDFENFRNIIFLAGSFPKDMNGIAVDSIHDLPMFEYEVFKSLLPITKRILVYGDYGNIHPIINPDPTNFPASCTIKYTVKGAFRIFRGTVAGKVPQGTGQYVQKSKLIVASNIYDGPDFSYGDREIKLYAEEKKKGNGSATTWITNTINHHIAKMVSELD